MNKEYPIPEPSKEPIKSIVIYYKVLKGVEYDDRVWDKCHFGRYSKSGKFLLQICGSFKLAKECIDEVSANLEEGGLSWTLETIVSKSHEWMNKQRGKDANKSRKRFLDALTRQRSDNALEIKGEEPSQDIGSMGNIHVIQYKEWGSEGIGIKSDGGSDNRMGEEKLEKKATGTNQ